MNFVGGYDSADITKLSWFSISLLEKRLPFTESNIQLLSFYLVMSLGIDTFVKVKCTLFMHFIICTHAKLLNVFKESFDILRKNTVLGVLE